MSRQIIPIRLSHSSLQLLNSCERKWQLEKLLDTGNDKEESEHLVFGTAYGRGVAVYAETQDANKALFEAWLAYYPELESEKKSWAKCFALLENSFFHLDSVLQDYEFVYYNGKPAAELSFRLNISPEYYFVGHIDLILRHKWTKQFCVFEVKHTGLAVHDLSPLYANSGQALGYSVALDKIVGEEVSSYDVVYFVGQLDRDYGSKIHVLPFGKTLLDRLNWFISLGLDVKRIEMMRELGSFPKRGDSCMKYNRPCFHFSTCNLSLSEKEKEREEDTIQYDFTFDLNELIEDHVRRVNQQRNTLLGEE